MICFRTCSSILLLIDIHPFPLSVYPLIHSSLIPGTKSLPIHCIVEQMPGVPTFDPHNDCITPITVELDSYAILPSNTQMCELVRTALIKLGYNSAEIMGAKGETLEPSSGTTPWRYGGQSYNYNSYRKL